MTDIEAKDIYAHFDLAFYYANCLEHGIINTLWINTIKHY